MQHNTRNNNRTQIDIDTRLPDEIKPPVSARLQDTTNTTQQQPSTHAFITGATGFLGRYVIRSLLQQTKLKLTCLIRADDKTQAQQRLNDILATVGITDHKALARINVVCGDLTQIQFGLSTASYEQLAQSANTIYHCAALVNWARSYCKLRHINALGTLEVIRFACHLRSKPLLFVSSMAVCYATNRAIVVNENTDMLPHIEHMPLGYAQSKCVAESLLRQAAQRGLPVTILRPALISGATDSGISNTEDFVAALLEGCVRTGIAMDEGWLLDFVPVDFVAEVIASLPLLNTSQHLPHEQRPTILHLVADRPRYWRELILWLNLYGYPVSLVPPTQWLTQVFKDRKHCGRRLYSYRRFFQGLPGQAKQKRPYECYLQTGQQRIDSSVSTRLLTKVGLETPALEATLLQRYLSYFQQHNLLPKLPARLNTAPSQDVILQVLQQPNARLQPLPLNTDNGILNQVAAAYAGAAVGLRAYHVTDATTNTSSDIVVKTKCADALVEDSTVQMAALCSPKLGELFTRFRAQLGLAGAQQREAALYQLPAPALRRYTPHCFGTHHDQKNGLTTIVLEKLPETPQIDNWNEQQILDVIKGLTHIQTVDCSVLSGMLKPERSTEIMLEMAPLWHELARFAAGQCDIAAQLLPLQQRYIDELGDWWPQLLEQPQVLVHGDFNPRNLVLRNTLTPLCAYDWELAALGAPQRDLAEFLCFTLNLKTHTAKIVHALIETHRQHYTELAQIDLSATDWQQGFDLALRQFAITRLPMYALMHRFRPQSFWPKLNTNALWLLQR